MHSNYDFNRNLAYTMACGLDFMVTIGSDVNHIQESVCDLMRAFFTVSADVHFCCSLQKLPVSVITAHSFIHSFITHKAAKCIECVKVYSLSEAGTSLAGVS